MSYNTIIRRMFRSVIARRKQINEYLETLDGSPPGIHQDRTVTYAIFAIVGLLLFGAIILGGMALKLMVLI